jgi:sulfite reductase (ferredoxin)
VPDHLGWHEQGDGKLYLGLPISSGRIVDGGRAKLRTALHEIVAEYGVDPILMPSQDIILSAIDPADRDAIEARLRAYGVRFGSDMVPAERWALACPALPTCGLALTEAERVSDMLVAEIVERMARWGVEEERLSIRITGCPNGCARPYSGDIGIVGRIPGFYSIYVGGDFEGTRLNAVVAERIRLGEVADVLDPLFAVYAQDRAPGEGFGDFCHRTGIPALQQVLAEARGKARDAAD